MNIYKYMVKELECLINNSYRLVYMVGIRRTPSAQVLTM